MNTATTALPAQMRAMAIDRFGCPRDAACHTIATPQPAPGELLVQMAAVGVNPADWKALMGWLPPWAAGLGMASSSLLVILNSLRLAR